MRLIHGIAIAMALLVFAYPACADDAGTELAKKTQNPVADLISVPLQSNWDWGDGETKSMKYWMNAQPVIPVSLSPTWNLISRTILPVVHMEAQTLGGSTKDGIGDTTQSVFFSPKNPVKGWIVGAGPVLVLPTATDPALGTEQWSAGPTGVALKQEGGWTIGALANHAWSFAGHDHRSEVNSTFLQPFLAYTYKTLTTLGIQTESTYNWADTQWTVPVIVGVSQIVKVGGQPINLQIGPRYYAEGPEGSPNWGLRFTVTLLFPK